MIGADDEDELVRTAAATAHDGCLDPLSGQNLMNPKWLRHDQWLNREQASGQAKSHCREASSEMPHQARQPRATGLTVARV